MLLKEHRQPMEVKQRSPSVIARLMGFDDVQMWQPVQKKARVLSEDYLQRVASIGKKSFRQKCTENHSLNIASHKQKDYDHVFKALEALKRRDKHPRMLSRKREEQKPLKVSFQSSGNLVNNSQQLDCSFSMKHNVSKHTPCNWKLRQGMRRYCRGREISLITGAGTCPPPRKIAVLKPDEGRTEDSAKSFPWWSNSSDSSCLGNAYSQTKASNNLGSWTKPVRQRSRFSNPAFRQSGDISNRVRSDTVTKDSKFKVPITCTWESGRDSVLPSQDQPASFQQDISNEIVEKEKLSLYRSISDPDSSISLEGNCQLSPDSVLEPLHMKESLFSSDYSESARGCSNGLNMQVELQYSETSEACSEAYPEGSGEVSGDEKDGKESVCDLGKNGDQVRMCKVSESRDFSYLVDLLREAGFHQQDLQMDPVSWEINSSVFENLEKKYGEQILWKRSERRLLFDRINSVLLDMLQPSIGVPAWTKSVGRRFRHSHGEEAIEDKAWRLLVCRENEASQDSDKVLGKDEKWMDLRKDIWGIGQEIENSLMIELVEDAIGELV